MFKYLNLFTTASARGHFDYDLNDRKRNNGAKLIVKHFNTSVAQYFYQIKITTTWNALSNEIVRQNSDIFSRLSWTNTGQKIHFINRNPAQSLQKNIITACIWASAVQLVAKYLRDIESVETKKIKFEFDKLLEFIPDEPKMPNYVNAARSNIILDQQSHLRAQGIYQGGGVLDSATEKA